MPKEIFLVRKNQKEKPQFLKLVLEGATVTREYGRVGGEVLNTGHTYDALNVGKVNEKSPEAVAEEDFQRIVKNKKKDGYVETENLDDLSVLDQEEVFDLDNPSTAFCISKPKKTVTISMIDKVLKSGNGKIFIKYNGIGHFILIRTNGEIKVYTRKWCDHTLKYPEIITEVKAQGYPNGTLFYAEFCIDPQLQIPHMKAFLLMSQISKADVADGICKPEVPKSLALQKKHRVRAAIITILFCDNKPAHPFPYKTILNSLALKTPSIIEGKAVFAPKEVPIDSGQQAMDIAKTNKDAIEGFVLWDTSQNMEVTMNGKPNRCASWKIKVRGDADVIATGYVKGTGKNQNRIGSLKIGQYDSNGDWLDLGTVGSGLTDADRDPDTWTFPQVIEVTFDQRFPDTGKFQFGRFSKKHEYKLPEDADVFTR